MPNTFDSILLNKMEIINTIFGVAILIMSVVIHELSHGYTADLLGDPTPRLQGRLTLNPLKHLELFGSVIMPILTSMTGFTFGWAKPVEWNPYNVKNKRLGEFLISIAGPVSNLIIAIVFSLIIRNFDNVLSQSFIGISYYVIIINVTLAIFNMIPVPPLDGSKVLFSLLPTKYIFIREYIERYSMIGIFVAVFFLWRFIEPVIGLVIKTLTGV